MKTSRLLLGLAYFSSDLNFYLPCTYLRQTYRHFRKIKVAIVEKYPFKSLKQEGM